MKSNLHSEKEILIFNGVMKLMNEGVNIHTIKVADIAKSVGIGKGTVYEYFKSKDELLEKSLIYCMNLSLNKAIEKIDNANGFKEKIYTMLEIAKCNVQEFNSGNGFLFSNMGTCEFAYLMKSENKEFKFKEKIYTMLEIAKCNVQEFNSGNGFLFSNMGTCEFAYLMKSENKEFKYRENIINKSIEDVISVGIEEEVIKCQRDKEYEKMVIKSAIIGFANDLYCSKSTMEKDIYELKERSYKLIIKGLN